MYNQTDIVFKHIQLFKGFYAFSHAHKKFIFLVGTYVILLINPHQSSEAVAVFILLFNYRRAIS